MSRDKRGRGFTSGRRKVLERADRPCSIDGCDALAEASITIGSPAGAVRYYGCVDHIDGMREALEAALREIEGR